MHEALITSALESAARAEEIGLGPRQDHIVLQDERRAGPDHRLP